MIPIPFLAQLAFLFLAQLAFIVSFGVLPDTFIVRMLLVPAFALGFRTPADS